MRRGLFPLGRRVARRENRLWERRADVYAELATFVLKERTRAGLEYTALQADERRENMPPEMQDDEWFGMLGQVWTFGSQRAYEAVDDLLDLRTSFNTALANHRRHVADRDGTHDRLWWSNRRDELEDRTEVTRAAYRTGCERVREVAAVELRSRSAPDPRPSGPAPA